MAYTVIRGKLVKIQRHPWTGKNNIGTTIRENAEAEKKKALKGMKNGNCNVTRCQKPGATWWNIGASAYYCRACAMAINIDGCRRYGEPDLCFPSREEGEAAQAGRIAEYRNARGLDTQIIAVDELQDVS